MADTDRKSQNPDPSGNKTPRMWFSSQSNKKITYWSPRQWCGFLTLFALVVSILFIILLFAEGPNLKPQVLSELILPVDSLQENKEFYVQSWNLDPKKNKLMKVEISIIPSMPSSYNNNLFLNVDIFDADKELLINSFGTDLYFESGSDSDGRWTENRNKHEEYFKVDSAGVFYAALSAEKSYKVTETSKYIPLEKEIKIYDGLQARVKIMTGEDYIFILYAITAFIFGIISFTMFVIWLALSDNS